LKEVVVYSKPNCSYCEDAKNILKSRKISYKVVDVSVDKEALKMLKDEGFKSVPQIYVDGVHVGDSETAIVLEV
jgi:glutaredoxin